MAGKITMNREYMEKASYDWSEDSVRIINTPSTTAKSTYYYVQEIGYFKTIPPYFTERSGLPSFLIVYTISGEGTLIYEGESHTLTAGSCFYIDCMKSHRYSTNPGSEWEFLWVHFYGATSVGYYDEFSGSGTFVTEMTLSNNKTYTNEEFINICEDPGNFDMEAKEKDVSGLGKKSHSINNCMDENQNDFLSDFYKLLDINLKKEPYHELRSSNLILNMLTKLLLINSAGQSGMHGVSEYVRGVSRYIDKHFRENISLDLLADIQHISKYHLSREFKRWNGITIQEYLINSRVTYAKELLKHSEKSVSEIADLCGISNVSHFINIFKEREGMTPLSYRKMWK